MGFPISGNYSPTPKKINTPKAKYGPIVAGGWTMQRKTGNVNITVNNYIDSSNPRGWSNDAWAKLDQNQDSGGGFWDKFAEVTGVAGAIIGGVGTVLSALGLGGKKTSAEEVDDDSAVTPQNEDPEVTEQEDEVEVAQQGSDPAVSKQGVGKTEAQPGSGPATSKQGGGKTEAQQGSDSAATRQGNPTTASLGADADKINALADGEELDDDSGINWDGNATVRDQESTTKTRDIKGKMKVGNKTDGKYPKTFTISDSSGDYTFKLVGTDKATGKPVYQCTSGPSGQTYSKGNNYVLKDMQNGQPTLEQPSNYAGSGESLKKSNEI